VDFSCPSCGVSLKEFRPKVVPLPGQRRLLPLQVGMACVNCNARVRMNQHPVETRVRRADASLLLLALAASLVLNDSRYFVAGLVVSGIGELLLWGWARKSLGSWKRYAIAS
jgi:hypothetical protein